MSFNIAIVMDPLQTIKPEKDTTRVLMQAAARRDATIFHIGMDDLFIEDGRAHALARSLTLSDNLENWAVAGADERHALTDFDLILMRKDPPVDKRFIHACYVLEQAVRDGATVLNNPAALIALNEKLFATHFPDLCPPTLITSSRALLRDFIDRHQRIIIKPLDAMGGAGVFMVDHNDVNFDVIWEVQTARGTYPVAAQSFIPEIDQGDTRIIMADGKAYPHVMVRMPAASSIRGNLAAGGRAVIRPISAAEQVIADRVGPALLEHGIIFAGIDVIGGRLIEINITSPTGLREIEKGAGVDIGAHVMDALLRHARKG